MADVPKYDNRDLFIKLAEGDEAAFRQLFDIYRLQFFSAAFKLTRSAALAEDIVQEVFIILWEKREQVAGADSPLAYFVRILQNKISNALRALIAERQALRAAGDNNIEIDDNPIEELLHAKENRAVLDEIISRLPQQQQIVYRLAKQASMSRDDIAKQLNISPNTVRNHLAAATEFIRKNLPKHTNSLILSLILTGL